MTLLHADSAAAVDAAVAAVLPVSAAPAAAVTPVPSPATCRPP